jgi:tetratricopeptide (TPR) repeat protein
MSRNVSRATLIGAAGVLIAGASVLLYVVILALTAGPDTTVEAGRDFLQKRWHYRAIETLTAVLDREPRNLAAHALRGKAYLETGQLDHAQADFQAVRKADPANLNAKLGLASILRRRGKLDEALAAARTAADDHPARPEPMAVIGRCHYARFQKHARECVRMIEATAAQDALAADAAREIRSGRFDSTERFLASWRDRDPAEAKRSDLAEHLAAAKANFERAVENLRVGIGQTAQRPGQGDASTWLLLAAVLLERGDLDQARQIADAARRLPDVNRVEAGILLADIHAAQADALMAESARTDDAKKRQRAAEMSNKAIAALEDLVRDFPNAAEVRRRLAMQYIRTGRPDDAEEQALQTLRQTKSDVGHYVLGIVHLMREEYDEAVTELLLAKSMKQDPRYHFLLGRAYERGGDKPRIALAADEYKEVVRLRPRFVPALLSLARLRLRQGWAEEARAIAARIYAIPGQPPGTRVEACMLLGEANRALKNYDRVIHWMQQAQQIQPASVADAALIDAAMEREVVRNMEGDTARDAAQACVLGVIRRRKGQLEKAEKRFKEAKLLDPQYIPAYVYLANLYVQSNELDKAVDEFEAAIKLAKDLRQPPNASLHFGRAVVRIRQKRYADAKRDLEAVLDIDANYTPARLRLAALLLRERRFRDALDNVDRAVTAGSETAEARFIGGLIHSAIARRPADEIKAEIRERRSGAPLLRGQPVTDGDIAAARRVAWENAIQDYERAIELDPEFRFSYEVGLIYAMRERYAPMASAYARAVKVAPPADQPPLRRRLAVALLGLGSFDKAVLTARKARDQVLTAPAADPDEVLRSRYVLANCLLGKGDFAGARAEIARLGGAPPRFTDYYLAMVDRVEQLFVHADERPKPERAVRMHRDVAVRLNRAFLFSRGGVAWLGEAERVYGKLLDDDPGNLIAMHHLGEIYLVRGRLEQAEEMNRRILSLSPRDPSALRSLAVIEDRRTRTAATAADTPATRLAAQAGAIELYQRAIQADKTYWLPRLELAQLYARAGAAEQAMALYREVIALNPSQVQALNDYAVLCAEERRDLKQAIDHARRARRLSPFRGEIADTLGVLWTILGEPDAAVRQLEQARALLPNSRAVQFHLAEAYHKGGRLDKALGLLEQLLGTDESFPLRERAAQLRERIRAEKSREGGDEKGSGKGHSARDEEVDR